MDVDLKVCALASADGWRLLLLIGRAIISGV